MAAPGIEGTVSYAVITGASFNAEIGAHGIGFLGAVPSGTLGPVAAPAATDFVYLYQLVSKGPSQDLILSWDIGGGSGGVGSASGLITAGARLAALTANGLSGGPSVDFQNGLGAALPGDPVVPPWFACLGSGVAGVNCSGGQADLLAASVLISNWQETPSGVSGGGPGPFLNAIDPLWSGSVIWFASPNPWTLGTTTITDIAGLTTSGSVPGPVPAPATVALLGLELAGLGYTRRRRPGA